MVLNQGSAGDPGSRLRVLMIVRLFHPWVGGTERQAQKLARALLDAGADVQVVTGRWFPQTPRREIIDGVRVFRNHTLWEFFGIKGLRKLGGYLYILTLAWHLWRRRATYEVIHVHGLSYHTFAAAITGRRLGKPVVVKLANSGPASDIRRMREGQQLAGSRLMLPGALACDGFVALNAQVVSELADAGVERSRIVEIPNGVATAAPRRTDHRLRQTPCILYVGRLHRQKGLDTLIRAFALLCSEQSPVDTSRLQLVGEGPARRELEELAETLGVSANVDFAGSHEDVQPFLDEADVFVLPSSAEGLSNALLEAMACGLPVIVSEIPGNRDVVEDGVNGLLTPVGDASALAATLMRLLDDEPLRAALGQAARSTILQHYGIEYVAEEYLRLYQELRAGAVTDPARLGA
jgi:L-malate glycosyltransferase